jgi:hypothetical protein
MIGQLCGSYDQYLAGGCLSCEEPGERCAVMGYHMKKHRYRGILKAKKFYFDHFRESSQYSLF